MFDCAFIRKEEGNKMMNFRKIVFSGLLIVWVQGSCFGVVIPKVSVTTRPPVSQVVVQPQSAAPAVKVAPVPTNMTPAPADWPLSVNNNTSDKFNSDEI